jgi:hypothetical protein
MPRNDTSSARLRRHVSEASPRVGSRTTTSAGFRGLPPGSENLQRDESYRQRTLSAANGRGRVISPGQQPDLGAGGESGVVGEGGTGGGGDQDRRGRGEAPYLVLGQAGPGERHRPPSPRNPTLRAGRIAAGVAVTPATAAADRCSRATAVPPRRCRAPGRGDPRTSRRCHRDVSSVQVGAVFGAAAWAVRASAHHRSKFACSFAAARAGATTKYRSIAGNSGPRRC